MSEFTFYGLCACIAILLFIIWTLHSRLNSLENNKQDISLFMSTVLEFMKGQNNVNETLMQNTNAVANATEEALGEIDKNFVLTSKIIDVITNTITTLEHQHNDDVDNLLSLINKRD